MSERVTWVDCPCCGDRAAVGWQTVIQSSGASREDAVEFDCIEGCHLTDSQLLLYRTVWHGLLPTASE